MDNLGGRGCYTGLDLFVAFDHWALAIQSQDLTTFQTPLGLLHLTSLPMGATNSVQILQGDVSFILQDEMPGVAVAFMDGVNIKGPSTRYEMTKDGWYTSSAFADPPAQSRPVSCASGTDGLYYEVIAENFGIRQFIWEHVHDSIESFNVSRKPGVPSPGGKWNSAYPR